VQVTTYLWSGKLIRDYAGLLLFYCFQNVYYSLDIFEEVKRMYIKIYTKSQLILLRSLLPVMKKKYRLPNEILDKVYRILKEDSIGENGFIGILLEPLHNDTVGIKDIVNCYPRKLKLLGDIQDIKIQEQGSWMTKGKEWYMDTIKIRKEDSYIYFIYSMTLEELYGSNNE